MEFQLRLLKQLLFGNYIRFCLAYSDINSLCCQENSLVFPNLSGCGCPALVGGKTTNCKSKEKSILVLYKKNPEQYSDKFVLNGNDNSIYTWSISSLYPISFHSFGTGKSD